MLERLASYCFRKRRLVVLLWVLALPAASFLAQSVGGKFESQGGGRVNGAESQQATDLISARLPEFASAFAGTRGDVVFEAPGGIVGKKAEIEKFLAVVAKQKIVAAVESPFTAERPAISRDGTIAQASITFKKGIDFTKEPRKIVPLAKELRAAGVQTEFGGQLFINQELPPSEIFGLIAAVIILLLAFGSLIAMGLPILTALFGVGIAVALVQLSALIFTMPAFVTSLTGMIGLGVGIDYVLFIVTRYKEELNKGMSPHDATVKSLGTSGKAVVFAGITVVISMLGMFIMGLPFINGIAIAGAMPVFVIVLASITLIPAMLGFIGHKINSKRQTRKLADESRVHRETGWHKWSRLVQRRAWPFAIGGLALLMVLAIPVFSMRLGFSDRGNDKPETTTRKAYDLQAKGFGPGANGPLIIALDTKEATGDAQAAIGKLVSAISTAKFSDPTVGVAAALPPDPRTLDKQVAIVTVLPKTGPQDIATENLLKELRKNVIRPALEGTGIKAYVGGFTAGGVDFSAVLAKRIPLFMTAVLGLSFLLLMAVFRSVLVPLKAVIMNLLSIGASFGIVVFIFQEGHFGSLIGLGKGGPIEPFAPMMLFAIVFGLSMDYEVFLLSKIKEEFDHRGDNSEAVVEGLASTARLITAAAAIMVCVFLGFVLGERTIKLFGIGLSMAVFLDATIVRVLLVPATMELLGAKNWWIPKWLDRILPKLDVEGTKNHRAAVEASLGHRGAAAAANAKGALDQ